MHNCPRSMGQESYEKQLFHRITHRERSWSGAAWGHGNVESPRTPGPIYCQHMMECTPSAAVIIPEVEGPASRGLQRLPPEAYIETQLAFLRRLGIEGYDG